jgi:cobyrinic acid a,c-diamide synthase
MPCRHTADADVAVVEGVMGLFDSRDGISDDGSTAQVSTSRLSCQSLKPITQVPVALYVT